MDVYQRVSIVPSIFSTLTGFTGKTDVTTSLSVYACFTTILLPVRMDVPDRRTAAGRTE